MPKYLMKIQRGSNYRRVNIPKRVVEKLQWQDVIYVTLDDSQGDMIVIERIVEQKQLSLLPKKGEV